MFRVYLTHIPKVQYCQHVHCYPSQVVSYLYPDRFAASPHPFTRISAPCEVGNLHCSQRPRLPCTGLARKNHSNSHLTSPSPLPSSREKGPNIHREPLAERRDAETQGLCTCCAAPFSIMAKPGAPKCSTPCFSSPKTGESDSTVLPQGGWK